MQTAVRWMLAAMLVSTGAAGSAQLLGGRVGAGVGVGAPDVGGVVDNTARTVDGATRATTDTAADAAAATSRDAPVVRVRAGASMRVDRGTRCYYQPDDYYYDPVYRDGYYYCERRSAGAGVGAAASVAPR